MNNWKQLLINALRTSPARDTQLRSCRLLGVYRYIHWTLNRAGIGNRSPFGWRQVIAVWWQARTTGKPLDRLLIECIERMQKPAPGFYRAGQLVVIITLLLPLFALVPRSASTFAPGVNSPAILRFVPLPAADNDTLEIRLPETADYLLAANQFLDHPVLYPRTLGLLRANWIADQPDTHYGLQILSTSSLERLAAFCKKHQICAQSAYLEVEVKKQHRYRLIHGSFSSKQAAERANASLSPPLRSLKPWPRSYRQLKQAING